MGSSPKCFYVMWPYRSVLFAKLISCPTCSVCRVLNAEEEGQDSTVFLLRDPALTSLLRRSRWPATARGPPCKAAHVLCSPSDAAGPDTCAFRCVADATRLASPWLAALHVPRIQALDRARVAFLGTWPLAWPVQEVGVLTGPPGLRPVPAKTRNSSLCCFLDTGEFPFQEQSELHAQILTVLHHLPKDQTLGICSNFLFLFKKQPFLCSSVRFCHRNPEGRRHLRALHKRFSGQREACRSRSSRSLLVALEPEACNSSSPVCWGWRRFGPVEATARSSLCRPTATVKI